MLRFEMPLRPLTSRLKFDTQKVPDLAIDAVTDFAGELAFWVGDPYIGLQWNRLVELQTGARKRNVLQIGDAFPNPAGIIFPLNVHHVRT